MKVVNLFKKSWVLKIQKLKMSNGENTEVCVVLMKPRCTAKKVCQHADMCLEVHKPIYAPYNDRTSTMYIFLSK